MRKSRSSCFYYLIDCLGDFQSRCLFLSMFMLDSVLATYANTHFHITPRILMMKASIIAFPLLMGCIGATSALMASKPVHISANKQPLSTTKLDIVTLSPTFSTISNNKRPQPSVAAQELLPRDPRDGVGELQPPNGPYDARVSAIRKGPNVCEKPLFESADVKAGTSRNVILFSLHLAKP